MLFPHNSTLLSGVDQVPLISASAQQMTATVAAASIRNSYWNSRQVACTAHHYNIPKLAILLRRAKHPQKGKVTATCLTPVEKSECVTRGWLLFNCVCHFYQHWHCLFNLSSKKNHNLALLLSLLLHHPSSIYHLPRTTLSKAKPNHHASLLRAHPCPVRRPCVRPSRCCFL